MFAGRISLPSVDNRVGREVCETIIRIVFVVEEYLPPRLDRTPAWGARESACTPRHLKRRALITRPKKTIRSESRCHLPSVVDRVIE
jgi:hypothetical protein